MLSSGRLQNSQANTTNANRECMKMAKSLGPAFISLLFVFRIHFGPGSLFCVGMLVKDWVARPECMPLIQADVIAALPYKGARANWNVSKWSKVMDLLTSWLGPRRPFIWSSSLTFSKCVFCTLYICLIGLRMDASSVCSSKPQSRAYSIRQYMYATECACICLFSIE